MTLGDYLNKHQLSDLIYLGGSNSSGYIWIGPAIDVPEEQLNKQVVETYPHDTDVPGTTVIVKSAEHGSYWFWHECDPNAPQGTTDELRCTDTAIENLLIGIAKQCASDYRNAIRSQMKKVPKDRRYQVIEAAIRELQMSVDTEFLKGSSTGRYILQTVEDEERVAARYPEYLDMTGDARNAFMQKRLKEISAKRVYRKEKDMYATIKGRSVKHNALD